MDVQYKFTEEVKTLIDYTTAVPFKIRAGKIFCAFCQDREPFDDPDDLREHARVHENYAEMLIERALRPHFQNEILRIDIVNLHCKFCSTRLSAWNDMFEHLKEQHEIELDQAYTRLIPYKLRENKPYCALCKAEFPNFQFLDAHMNAHYCNYMCSQCGEPFLTEARLKHHLIIHNTGKFPCEQCGKIFHLEKYRKKHIAMVHREAKMFKCECGEAFHVDYERHQHIVKEHPEKVRVVTCEFCGKSFDWRPYYLAHLRKVHIKNKCNYCKYCKKGFITKHELKQHILRHEGKGKFVCLFCQKNFVTAAELRKHSQRHYINSEIEIISNEENSQDKTIIVTQLSNPEARSVKSKKIAIKGTNSKNTVVTESVKPRTQDVGKKVRKKIEMQYETDSLYSKDESKIKYKVIYHQ